MGEVLGLGMTHYPMLLGVDPAMAALLAMTLKDPDIPAERKDPANWAADAREDWSDDNGTAAAGRHRAALLADLAHCRAALDEFRPDVLVVWGDDQYENFREEIVPSFCVCAYDDTEVDPFASINRLSIPNAWGVPQDAQRFTMRGESGFAKELATSVINAGVDVAYSYELRSGINLPHAFANTQTFLDWDNIGREFPYPMIAIAVNCYGEHVIARRGGLARFADINAGEELDPPGPTPQRCFQLGRAVGEFLRTADKRVAVVASSSWSHAFLNDKEWHLHPDTPADKELYDALVRGDVDTWLSRTSRDIIDAGQHEILNWYCMLGAVTELGLSLEWSNLVSSEIFNSNKAFAIYR